MSATERLGSDTSEDYGPFNTLPMESKPLTPEEKAAWDELSDFAHFAQREGGWSEKIEGGTIWHFPEDEAIPDGEYHSHKKDSPPPSPSSSEFNNKKSVVKRVASTVVDISVEQKPHLHIVK